MQNNVDRLFDTMNLSDFQRQILRQNADTYDMRRLVIRGGVLYVRHRSHGFIDTVRNMFMGVPADLLGRSRMLRKMCRNITLTRGGYARIRIGRYTYYCDNSGKFVTRQTFIRARRGA